METGTQISLRERIRINLVSAMDEANVNQVQLADKLGIKKGTVNNWVRGNNSPDVDIVPRICAVLGIDIEKLYAPSDSEQINAAMRKENSPPLSDEEIKIAKDYRALDAHGKCMVRLVIAEELKHTVSRKGIVTLPTAFQRVHPGIRGLDDDNDPKTNMVSVPARNGGLVYWALSEKQFAQYNALVMQENEESAADDV